MTEILLTTLCTGHLYPLLPHLRGKGGIMTFQSLGIRPPPPLVGTS